MNHSQLFQQIETLVPQLDGWCPVDKACTLAAAIMAIRPNIVVEIGVFAGRSLLPMAMACEFSGHGKVIGIDPWNAVAGVEGYDGKNAEYWGTLPYDQIYLRLLENIAAWGVGHRVEIIRKKSDDVQPPSVIDILHVDGQHSEQAVRDVERFATNVRKGGFCFTDDDDWSGGGPAAACKRLLEIGFVPLYKCGTGTAFQRVT